MATITSTQSGNFSSTSTWTGGVVPVDGDRFDVGVGHTVTLDSGMSVPTNGFADSYVYGILQSQASASMTLRMNGRLYVKGGGCLHLRDGATIQINGSSSERHGVWIENETDTHVIMEGSDGMPCTTLSAAEAEGSTSLAVASGTNFAAGEWIAVFDHVSTTSGNTDQHAYANQDEGFWIHEVDGNTIYFRIFGGPTHVTIDRVSNSGERLFVSNAKVFREGQTIIFGTGSNRNIKTISSIHHRRNRLTLDSAVTGTVTGETVYLTATEKPHTNGSKVRKVATVTSASATSTATSITVANANMFTAGDEIWIEKRSEADSSTDHGGVQTDDYKHTISSVSSNTITVDAAIGYNVVEGALVTRMTRNIIIETVATDGSDYGFFYKESETSNFDHTFVAKDVYLRNMGNDDNNTDAGFVIRGRASTDNSPVSYTEQIPTRDREPWLEGIVCHAYPNSAHRRDWGLLWLYDFRHAKLRCGLAMNGEDGISMNAEPGAACYNSISVANRDRNFRVEGLTENWEFAYNYGSRSNHGLRALTYFENGFGFHDIIIDGNGVYFIQTNNADLGLTFYRCRFTGNENGVLAENSQSHLLYCYVKPLSGFANVEAGTGTRQSGSSYNGQYHRGNGGQPILSVEHNYEIDAMRLYLYNWEAYWDLEEKAWRCFRRDNNSNNPAMCERIYIPANTTVRVSGKCKLAPSFSGTYPYLFATDMTSNWNENQLDYATADSHKWSGKRYAQQFSTDAASAYEEEQITITSKPYPRQYLIGFRSSSNNAAEGFWLKDLQINIDKPYASPAFNLVNQCNKFSMIPTRVRSTFTEQKKRLGGRIF
tara:strand:+ start:1844 stop:4321 length:2478 start_codon:yes stop_codon:yes gene_type:complete